MAKLISKTYGEALFELAVEENKIDVFEQEIGAILDILNQNPDFMNLLNHPKIVKEEKLQVMEEVFGGKVTKEIQGFLNIIVAKERNRELIAIMEYFLNEVKAMKGVGVCYVTTPMELKDAQKETIVKRILETTEFKTMEMNYAVDEKLIVGMVI
ncbi:MAG: ATP synthase F1 subunit delta, partial [Lachnospiraceae bacterium]|nr:ATP synthase F1 subunit delta [Lachnospiraceae bacterium]